MKIVANSIFHPRISQAFRVPARPGRYPRRCKAPCDGARDPKTGIAIHCGCGYPVHRTEWEAAPGFSAYAEWADAWDNAGKNNIVIVVEEDPE